LFLDVKPNQDFPISALEFGQQITRECALFFFDRCLFDVDLWIPHRFIRADTGPFIYSRLYVARIVALPDRLQKAH
jgi:hypothetical protein